jgi:phosphatidylserine decarboxylase
VNNVKRLFCLNERVVLNFESDQGRWSLVLVGATNVGHITVTHDPSLSTKQWFWREPKTHVYDPPHQVEPGDEVGMFHLGSTVVCVFEKSFGRDTAEGRMVRMGEAFV